MKAGNETPKAMYLYNPYFEVYFDIIKPMPRFKRWLWRMLGFEYREELYVKARIKATGKIVEVKYSRQMGPDAVYRDLVTGEHYMDFELSFLPEDGTPDYWTRLEHQYAGMAMQQLVHLVNVGYEYVYEETALIAMNFAHALVEKLKEKEERK